MMLGLARKPPGRPAATLGVRRRDRCSRTSDTVGGGVGGSVEQHTVIVPKTGA